MTLDYRMAPPDDGVIQPETLLGQSKEEILSQLIAGEYDAVVRQVGWYDLDEGTSQDASEEVAQLVVDLATQNGDTLPDTTFEFCSRNDAIPVWAAALEEGRMVWSQAS
ncbi:hypothetical protein IZ6_25690 [Terrihabitans soli]|uniref:Uncharacterized protein n=1 Tax=Terrihabitans soli TaxID=708113 RepID=A0A6S6QMW3_9HYPH|nr:hypothetical protein [Terrihabitans soli]BCJ91834.1 hypothetical protein IZ6_25690 [Terrihabitans soli]